MSIAVKFFMFWFICAFLCLGTMNGYMKGELTYYDRSVYGGCMVVSIMTGPIGLFASTGLSGFWMYGWDITPTLRDHHARKAKP